MRISKLKTKKRSIAIAIAILFLTAGILSAYKVPLLLAQLANSPDAVGPELAFFDQGGQEGVNSRVLVPQGFKGAVQIINLIGEPVAYNPAPGTNVTIRLAGITNVTTPEQMVAFAGKLNASNSFPAGTIVIAGNELNNLSCTEWCSDPNGTLKNNEPAIRLAARNYANLYRAFAGALDRTKYRAAPAPPDLYNGDYDPVPWVDEFASSAVCPFIDTLVANVFDVPSRVGLPNLETYKYLEQNLCGKKVVRFGGWGSDPNLSLEAQVNFLNNTPLPAGVLEATTLIVDNCGGNQGNVTKSGWMYYIRGKVFRADGSEVDPKTCTSSSTPYELTDVSCDDTVDPEFHSLRPYPASPCDRSVSRDVYMCANDLVVKETLRFTPSTPGGVCEPLPDGTGQKCYFFVSSKSNVSLGLSAADLPILGNTELVPNSTNNGASGLSFLQRVNEYVSWYLNGVVYRAEERPEDLATDPSALARIINLSGPLKKLLPRPYQTLERNDERVRVGVDRHDQNVVCGDVNNPQTCYTTGADPKRVTEVTSPQVWQNPETKAFPYVPFSSTEDRIGEGKSSLGGEFPDFDCSQAVPPTDRNIFGVNCAHFSATNATRELYFAHTEEAVELGTLLQSTFKSQDVDDRGTAPLDQFNDQNNRDITRYCEIVETRRNPGDRLYGDLERNGSQPINGTLDYTANVICEFKNPDPATVAQCQANCIPTDPNYPVCLADCTNTLQECKQEIFVPFRVQVSMPNAHTIYEKFVAGSQSIFKRFFPLVGPGAPVEEIKDIPGESNANYSSANQGVSGGSLDSASTIAGAPGEGRPGSSAKIFFPHLGSVYDYFLQGIQNALRPFGIENGENSTPGEQDHGDDEESELPEGIACPTTIPNLPEPGTGIICSINCNQNIPDSAIPAQYRGNIKANAIRIADAWIAGDTPDEKGKNYAAECYNDVVQRSLSAGINPVFSLAIWIQESDASNYTSRITKCDPADPQNTIQDFGQNRPEMSGNFDAQIKRFLRLPYSYPVSYPQCFPKGCSMESFSLIFQQGVQGECAFNEGAQRYADKTRRTMESIAPGCGEDIKYPTDLSCP